MTTTSTNPPLTQSLFCSNCGTAVNGTETYCPKCAAPQPNRFVTPQTVVRPTTYAGFWVRFIAIFIDSIIINAVMTPIAFVLMIPIGLSMRPDEQPDPAQVMRFMMPMIMIAGFTLVVSWLYEALMMSSSKRATLGKMIFGIIVVDTEGRQLTFGHATGRHFAKWISNMTMLIGYIMAAFTERKQALHDVIAGTLVLRQ